MKRRVIDDALILVRKYVPVETDNLVKAGRNGKIWDLKEKQLLLCLTRYKKKGRI